MGFLIENHDIFGSDLTNLSRIILIFELDRDIGEIILWAKILSQSDDFCKSYRVIGRTDILTDSRVYSPVEYTKTKIVAYLYSVSGKFMRIHTNCVDRISTQKGFEESWSRFRAGMSRGARINVIDLRKVTTKNERLRSSE